MNKEELYKLALSDVHKYALLNEIFAIRNERFPSEQQDNMLYVNGYLSLDLLEDYVNKVNEITRLNNIINELEKWLEDEQELVCGCGITRDYIYAYENCLDKLKELKEK